MRRAFVALIWILMFATIAVAYHRHQCPNCTWTWGHEENSFGNRNSHTCEKCGTQSWYHYNGPARAGTFGNPARAPVPVTTPARKTTYPELKWKTGPKQLDWILKLETQDVARSVS